MIDFMVLSAPRSGSTWAANWLTTERMLCIHDPVLETKVDDLDSLPHPQVSLGLACTALALDAPFVNRHSARRVVMHRDLRDVNASLERIGLTSLSRKWDSALENLSGMHVYYTDLFDEKPARRIWEYLTDLPFDESRHQRLARMRITPFHPRVPVDVDCARDFRHRIERAFA
jgi:hypothetical protein